MIKKGYIFLYDRSGEIVDKKQYDGLYSRGQIISTWKHIYGEGYKRCYLQYAPIIEIGAMINEDGSNRNPPRVKAKPLRK